MKKLTLALLIVLFASFAVAGHKRNVKVEVVAASEDRAFKYQAGTGLIGAIGGVRTTEQVFMVNTIIEGEHARLKCYENHRGCTALGPGNYSGELQGSDVWITIKVPLEDKVTRDHWRVAGSW